jgi:S-adenosylmethionine:tRNA ribosyltransferase-isomerase
MKTDELNYHLPVELIAQQPCGVRSESRLLVLNRASGEIVDSRFDRIGEFLHRGDCLVLNDTKVLSARFFGRRTSGGKIEGLFLAENEAGAWEVMLKNAGKVKADEIIWLKNRDESKAARYKAAIVDKVGGGVYRLKIETSENHTAVLGEIGFPPLPPYIKRGDNLKQAEADRMRYQTVYACKDGSVAAPTAGLHFTDDLIGRLKEGGTGFARITLHIGMGTFKPVETENLEEHKIHREWFGVDEENARTINATKGSGGRTIAVGTTSVRVLETVTADSKVKAASGTTELFIRPGYKFRMVDGMVTNFHLPKSTLLALVAAFAGLEKILAAYRYAIEERYRFYSYGDAMLIV